MNFWEKIYRYEFWPYWLFYIPTIPYFLYLAIKSRTLLFFSNVNPGIYLSGVVLESKSEILKHFPEKYIAKSLYFNENTNVDVLLSQISQHLNYPIIIKPDVGERGDGVMKIYNTEQLINILPNYKGKFIVQEFVNYEYELGVFYFQIPESEEFGITSIVQKGFLEVIGDGHSTVKELLSKNERAILVWDYLEKNIAETWNYIPALNEKIISQPIGNHCKGTAFYNANHLINHQSKLLFKNISYQFKGFNYGRFDIKLKSLEDLYSGENLKIMEVNGVSSEPGHIYDPKYKLWKAYRDIFKHYQIVYKISITNKKLGFKPAKFNEFYWLMKKFYSMKNV